MGRWVLVLSRLTPLHPLAWMVRQRLVLVCQLLTWAQWMR